jgi:GT2 family glycosyltransferase
MKKIAIVTVSFNGSEDTLELLESGNKLITEGLDISWIVVDNGSTDNLAKKVSEKWPRVETIQTGSNLGFAGGYNFGMKYGISKRADCVLAVNNDTLFADGDIVTKMVSTLYAKKSVAIVAPKIWFAPGFEYLKSKYKKNHEDKIIWYAGGEFDWDNLMSVHRGIDRVDTGKYDGVENVDFVSGCCFLVKREALQDVGYFDERLFAYFEDNDWIMRAKKRGWKLRYDGRVGIWHKVSRTVGIGSGVADYYITRNRLEFAKRYASTRTKLAIAREAIRMLVFGRLMQKRGVRDFLFGKWGKL